MLIESKFLKKPVAVIPTTPTVVREGVEVKGILCCLGEFAVFNNLSSKPRVEGIKKIGPIIRALNLAPFVRYVFLGGHGWGVVFGQASLDRGFKVEM